MKTIYKYAVPLKDTFTINLPKGYTILSVGVQNVVSFDRRSQSPYIWVLIDTENVKNSKPVNFRLAGTGHPIEEYSFLRFIGTFQLQDGALVFHLFEILDA